MGNVLANRCRARSQCRYNRLQEDRINGQHALRKLVADKTLAEVDWQALIQKADELHRTEKRELDKSDLKWRRKQRRKSKSLRRKFARDAGVYCVNLLSDNCRSSFLGSEDDTRDAGYITFDPNEAEVRTLDNTSSSCVDRLTSSSSGEAADVLPLHFGFKEADPIPKPSPRNQQGIRCSSIQSSTSSSIYLLDDATYPTFHDVATRVACILHNLESMAHTSQPMDIKPKLATFTEGRKPTAVNPQPGCVPKKEIKQVDGLEPIDMVDIVSKCGTSSDDEVFCRLNELSAFDVQPDDISKLTDDEEIHSLTEHFDVNHTQLRSAWNGPCYTKGIFSKSLAPDGSNQITL